MAQFIAFTSEQPCIIPLIVSSCMLCSSVCKVVHGHRLGLYVALYRYNIQYCNNILYSIICVYYTVLYVYTIQYYPMYMVHGHV